MTALCPADYVSPIKNILLAAAPFCSDARRTLCWQKQRRLHIYRLAPTCTGQAAVLQRPPPLASADALEL